MASSKKLQVMIALTDLLKTVTPVAGVHDFDLSNAVFRGRTVFSDNSDPIPLVSILENLRPAENKHAGYNKTAIKTELDLIIQGWVKDDKQNPTDEAYELLLAVESKLAEVIKSNSTSGFPSANTGSNYLLGGLIENMMIGDGICRPPDPQVSSKAFFFLPVTVVITRELGVS